MGAEPSLGGTDGTFQPPTARNENQTWLFQLYPVSKCMPTHYDTLKHSWPAQRAARPVKVHPGIVKRFLRHYSDGCAALNLAIQISKRLHWVLCIIESQLLN